MMKMKEMVYKDKMETELLYEGVYKNHKFAIVSRGTHPCAYVECNLNNLESYFDERLTDLNYNVVHGGFTFCGENNWSSAYGKCKYLGWDYGHSGDLLLCELNNWASCYLALFDGEYEKEPEEEPRAYTTEQMYEDVKRVITELVAVEKRENSDMYI